MFTPNNRGIWTKFLGTDKFGQPLYSTLPMTVPCGVVNLNASVKKTPVRTEASASKGNVDEIVVAATILFPNSVQIGEEDKFAIASLYLRVMMVEPRYDMSGNIDHYQCDFEEWEQ